MKYISLKYWLWKYIGNLKTHIHSKWNSMRPWKFKRQFKIKKQKTLMWIISMNLKRIVILKKLLYIKIDGQENQKSLFRGELIPLENSSYLYCCEISRSAYWWWHTFHNFQIMKGKHIILLELLVTLGTLWMTLYNTMDVFIWLVPVK